MPKAEATWIGVLFGFCLSVLAAFHHFKLPPVLPLFLNNYGYGPTLAGAFMSIYAIAGLTLSLRLSSALQGPRLPIYIQTAFSFLILGSLVTLVWPDKGWIMLAARGVEGVGFTILAVLGPALCIAYAGRTGLPFAAALIATWIPSGALLSSAIGATVRNSGQWQVLWWAGIFLTLVMWVWFIRRPAQHSTFVLKPAMEIVDNVEVATWRRGAQILTALLFAMWSCQLFGFMTWLPQYLVSVHDLALGSAIMGYSLPLIIIGLFNLVAAPILRSGMPVAALLTVALLGQAFIWFLVFAADGLHGLVFLAVYGVFCGLTPTCLYALPGTILGLEKTGPRAFGILMTGRNLGVLSGPLLLGITLQNVGGWNQATFLFGVITVCAALGAAMLHWTLSVRLKQ